MDIYETEDMHVTVNIYMEDADEICRKIIDWMKKHEAFHGESIVQNDDTLISAPYLLADIVDDIIQPQVTYKE